MVGPGPLTHPETVTIKKIVLFHGDSCQTIEVGARVPYPFSYADLEYVVMEISVDEAAHVVRVRAVKKESQPTQADDAVYRTFQFVGLKYAIEITD